MYTQAQKEFLTYKIKTINVHFSHMLRKEPWELQSDMDNKVKELKNEKKKKKPEPEETCNNITIGVAGVLSRCDQYQCCKERNYFD